MLFIRSILLLLLPLIAICSAERHGHDDDSVCLEELVEWLPSDAIKTALKDELAPKYRDGVFEHGKQALERLRHENPDLATKVMDKALHVEMSKQDLRKRANVTTPTTTPTTTTTTTSVPIVTEILVLVTLTTVDSNGKTVTKTTSAVEKTAKAQTTITTTTVTTDAQGKKTTSTDTNAPATVAVITDQAGNKVTTTKVLTTVRVDKAGNVLKPETTTDGKGNTVVVSGKTSGQIVTTTDAVGNTVVATYTPPGNPVSEVVYLTTMLPDGHVTTHVSYATVGGFQTTGVAGPSGSASGKPGLQSNTGAQTRGAYGAAIAVVLGFALGVAAML